VGTGCRAHEEADHARAPACRAAAGTIELAVLRSGVDLALGPGFILGIGALVDVLGGDESRVALSIRKAVGDAGSDRLVGLDGHGRIGIITCRQSKNAGPHAEKGDIT
jgi:hypothetical protein